MKRLFTSIVALILLCVCRVAWAEEEKIGPEVTASLKAWANEWKRDVPGSGRTLSDNVIVLAGPAVEVEFSNRIVVEASYLMSLSDYKFSEAGITTELDRRDIELAIGKWLNHYVGFFTGYRNSSFKEKGTGAKEFSYGATFSLRGVVPFIGTSSLYGNMTYLDARFKAEGMAREESPGWITEIGGRTVLTQQFAMKLGYKWETTEGKTSKVKDSFRGTVLELTYAF